MQRKAKLTIDQKLWIGVGVWSAMMLGLFIPVLFPGGVKHAVPSVVERTVAQIVDDNLSVAQAEETGGLKAQLDQVRKLFSTARSGGTRAFAVDALDWESKWLLTSDFVTGNNEHAEYLARRFAYRIFSEDDVEKVVQSAVTAFLRHLDDVESRLLLKLEADLAGMTLSDVPVIVDRLSFEQTLKGAVKEAISAVEGDMRGVIGQELVSIIAGQVLSSAAVELGLSSGILSAGAASGTVTFGVGLIVGLIVDALVGQIYDAVYDPTGTLERAVDEKLRDMERFILVGTEEKPGLEKRLQQYAGRRAQARKTAIEAVVLP